MILIFFLEFRIINTDMTILINPWANLWPVKRLVYDLIFDPCISLGIRALCEVGERQKAWLPDASRVKTYLF